MIKTITVAQCDICGKTEPAKAVAGRFNETEYKIPDSWKTSETNKDFCICYECWMKLEAHAFNYRMEKRAD